MQCPAQLDEAQKASWLDDQKFLLQLLDNTQVNVLWQGDDCCMYTCSCGTCLPDRSSLWRHVVVQTPWACFCSI